jgi:hypothetical protein
MRSPAHLEQPFRLKVNRFRPMLDTDSGHHDGVAGSGLHSVDTFSCGPTEAGREGLAAYGVWCACSYGSVRVVAGDVTAAAFSVPYGGGDPDPTASRPDVWKPKEVKATSRESSGLWVGAGGPMLLESFPGKTSVLT